MRQKNAGAGSFFFASRRNISSQSSYKTNYSDCIILDEEKSKFCFTLHFFF
ncbi:unnamed protein product, partial [Amoebophrya sp. A120]|eukprot:GSA120T00009111001.1